MNYRLRPTWIVGSMLLISLPLMGMACVPKGGTKGSASGTIQCKTDGSGCSVGGKIGITWGGSGSSQSVPIGGLRPMMSNSLDASQFAIDTSNSSVTVPQQGNVTIELVDSTTGAVQASHTFSWIRSGTAITLANPSAVNSWAEQNGGTADTANYQLASFQPGGVVSGLNTLTATSKYEGEVETSVSETWRGGPPCPMAQTTHGLQPNMRNCP